MAETSPDEPDAFTRFTTAASGILGRAYVFVLALIVLVVWAISGPVLGFSDTWQLIINTGTTIVTFLMVFIIQNTQNRDSRALNLKIEALMLELKINKPELYGAEAQGEKQLVEQQLEQAESAAELADGAGPNV
jgi:low affinity Fe/Cu permease